MFQGERKKKLQEAAGGSERVAGKSVIFKRVRGKKMERANDKEKGIMGKQQFSKVLGVA